MTKRDIEKNPDSTRPFRLWDAKAKHALRWRCYGSKQRAHMGALIECRWSEIGQTIEVIDIRNGRFLGSYTRRTSDIHFIEG